VAATTGSTPSRRDLARLGVAAAGLGVGTLALGACSPDDKSTENAAAATAGAGAGAQAGQVVTPLADVPVGGSVLAKAGDADVIVAQPEAGKVTAFSARCTHKGCLLGFKDAATLECPCHKATFDALTGAVTKGPAAKDLAGVAVAVQGANVVAT
jgi:nitrite reductase/ring-hydroxylating ferredoxin subunit